MNTFANAIKGQKTQTTNGMTAYVSTTNACLDLFGKIGSARTMDIIPYFSKAYNENREYALRIAQYARDARGGMGERKVFRDILKYLEKQNTEDAIILAVKAIEIGRWDDILVFEEGFTKLFTFDMIKEALEDGNALCAKWMPRESASNPAAKAKAKELREHFGWSAKKYRQTLSSLSSTVEQQMCANEWEKVEFAKVPSVAMTRYRRAFGKHQASRFQEYIDSVLRGDEKINASVSFPHDIVKGIRGSYRMTKSELDTIKAQWDALPNYVGDANMIPVVDTSGSMSREISKNTNAMDVSIALGMYIAEKNTGKFNGCFVSFASKPQLSYLNGDIVDRYKQVSTCLTMGSTDLEATFKQILQTAIDGNVPQEEMPEYIVILSDMQFNAAVHNCNNPTAFAMITSMYEANGYKRPNIIFWNLVGNYDNVPVKFDDNGTAFVSGYSVAMFKSLLSGNIAEFTPENVMLDAIMNDRYSIN